MRNPPQPLPENLWGDVWRFASLPAGDLVDIFSGRMMPIVEMPSRLLPLKLGLASTLAIPGVVIDGGKRSLSLARWLQSAAPVWLNFIPGGPDGLILAAGDRDRWILTTSEDPDVRASGELYENRKQAAKGLHFLLVQPDDSGMTYTGFWLMQTVESSQN
jgi:hypothetical protein